MVFLLASISSLLLGPLESATHLTLESVTLSWEKNVHILGTIPQWVSPISKQFCVHDLAALLFALTDQVVGMYMLEEFANSNVSFIKQM